MPDCARSSDAKTRPLDDVTEQRPAVELVPVSPSLGGAFRVSYTSCDLWMTGNQVCVTMATARAEDVRNLVANVADIPPPCAGLPPAPYTLYLMMYFCGRRTPPEHRCSLLNNTANIDMKTGCCGGCFCCLFPNLQTSATRVFEERFPLLKSNFSQRENPQMRPLIGFPPSSGSTLRFNFTTNCE